jgi:hypothetical protein
MLIFFMPSVVKLNIILLDIVVLSVFMPNAIMQCRFAECRGAYRRLLIGLFSVSNFETGEQRRKAFLNCKGSFTLANVT